MAGFCDKCSIEFFNEDFGDFAGIITEEQFNEGVKAEVLCEGCGGWIYVDHRGHLLGKVTEIN